MIAKALHVQRLLFKTDGWNIKYDVLGRVIERACELEETAVPMAPNLESLWSTLIRNPEQFAADLAKTKRYNCMRCAQEPTDCYRIEKRWGEETKWKEVFCQTCFSVLVDEQNEGFYENAQSAQATLEWNDCMASLTDFRAEQDGQNEKAHNMQSETDLDENTTSINSTSEWSNYTKDLHTFIIEQHNACKVPSITHDSCTENTRTPDDKQSDCQASNAEGVSLYTTIPSDITLGEGAFGSVAKAWCPQLNSFVATKTLHDQDSNSYTDLRNEAQMLSICSHPNIIQIYAFSIEGGCAQFIMELFEGGTLNLQLRDRSFGDEGKALPILEPILDGVAHITQRDIVHRDLKPENMVCHAGACFHGGLDTCGEARDEMLYKRICG